MRTRPLRPLLVALAALLLGCPGSSPEPGEAVDGEGFALSEQTERELAALGYGAWAEAEEGADAERAGVVRHDPARAFAGLNVLNTTRRPSVHLMDMEGRVVHTWHTKTPPGGRGPSAGEARDHSRRARWHHVEVLPGGDLIGIVMRRHLERVDWESNVLWRTPMLPHHDLDFDAAGRLLVLTHAAATLTLPGGEAVAVLDNGITIVDPADGRVLETISLLPFFGPLVTPELLERVDRVDGKYHDVFHLNTVEVVKQGVPGVARAGDVLLSVRELDLVAILDLEARRVVWQWGPGELSRQHNPSFLPNGNLLIFDNRPEDVGSRLVELDPRTKQIVWEYRGDPPASFRTATRGSASALPNGNLLVAESNRGRAFEIDRRDGEDGRDESVWEYFNPERDGKNRRGTFYRFDRLPPGHLAPGLLERARPAGDGP